MTTLHLQEAVNTKKLSKQQWIIFILCFLVILSDGIDTAVIGYIAPALIDDWGISKNDLRPVMSMALVGMCIGAVLSGILADKFGRKWVIIGSVFLFGSLTIGTAFANNANEMMLYRFITGLGLGAAMPNAATLVSEYMPQHRRAWMVNLLFCALPLGMTLGGVCAAGLLSNYGWQSVLYVGGIIPILVGIFAIFYLQDSLHILLKNKQIEKIRHLVGRIQGQMPAADTQFSSNTQTHAHTQKPVNMVAKTFFVPSLMMWLCCFMSLLVFYVLTSWMPTLLKEANYSPEQFSLIAAIFPFGGVAGTIIIGWFMDRFNANRTLVYSYFISALLFMLAAYASNNIYLLGAALFLAGGGLVGAQSSLPSLAALFYPAECRGVGVSWMHGLGRFGAIFGAFFGAYIFAFSLEMGQIFLVLSLPILISALALWMKGKHSPLHPSGLNS